MRLIGLLLSKQDPEQPHSLLTRVVVSLITLFSSLVYAGFFGLLCAVGVYLLGVELSRPQRNTPALQRTARHARRGSSSSERM
jgi:hypothetical protein